jgi:Na+-driven multidrug efflux pump
MIVAASIPFIGAQNAGAAVYRAMGNSRTPMLLSLLANLMNLGGNALLIYGLGWGIEGAAVPTLLSRMMGGIAMIVLLKKPGNILRIHRYRDIRFNAGMAKRIMGVGIPFGMENSMFQLGKLILLSLITTFGTVSITANAVANSIGSFGIIGGMSISLAISSVCAQCVGARDYEQVRYYTRKMVGYGYISNVLLNGVIFLSMPLIAAAYNLPEETARLVWIIIATQAVGAVTVWPTAFNLPNALRASNDGTFCMVVSLLSMWIFRVGCSYLFAKVGLGVVGVWVAMCIDWVARTICFMIRYRGERWYLRDEISVH